MGFDTYSEGAGLLGTGDPASSLNGDCGIDFGEAQGVDGARWEQGSERRLKKDWESSSVIVGVGVH